jgi:hypothetical protein
VNAGQLPLCYQILGCLPIPELVFGKAGTQALGLTASPWNLWWTQKLFQVLISLQRQTKMFQTLEQQVLLRQQELQTELFQTPEHLVLLRLQELRLKVESERQIPVLKVTQEVAQSLTDQLELSPAQREIETRIEHYCFAGHQQKMEKTCYQPLRLWTGVSIGFCNEYT